MKVAEIPTATLRAAARAWRHSDVVAAQHRAASGWFRWLVPEPNFSVHDRIDDLITEIEHLRFAVLTVDEVNGRLHAALHDIGIGGNGEHNWTLDEVRAVAWDALESKP